MKWLKEFSLNLNLLLVALLLAILVLPLLPPIIAYANPGWLAGYSYRQQFVLSRASGAVTDYVIPMTIYKGVGTSSGDVAYLNNHSSNWPNDIRFTRSDETTLLDYSLVFSNSTAAKVLVEFNSIGTGSTNFYIYYGKSGDSYGGNLTNVGLFGDDFNRANGALGGSWEVGGNTTAAINSSRMEWTHSFGDSPPRGVFHPFTFNSNVTQLVYSEAPNLPASGQADFLLADESASSNLGLWGVGYKNDAGTLRLHVLRSGGWLNVGTYALGTNYTFEIKYNNSARTSTFYIDGNETLTDVAGLTAGDWASHENKVAFTSDPWLDIYTYWDNVSVRAWVTPEPAWGSWGSEVQGMVVSTSVATSIGINAATLNGSIDILGGGGSATSRGFEWGTSTGVYTAGNWAEGGTFGVGSFSHTNTTLVADTAYYYRAFATNSNGTIYGGEQVFSTLPAGAPSGWLPGYNYRQKFGIIGAAIPLTDSILTLTVKQNAISNDYQGFLASLPFVRRAGPFLQPSGVPGTYDSDGLEFNYVIDNPNNPNQLLMYYAPGSLTAPKAEYAAVATSTKGSDIWTKYPGNPIVTAAGPYLRGSSPVYEGGIFYLYYDDDTPTVGAYLATSSDGFTFTKYNGGVAPVLAGAHIPFVTKFVGDSTWYMYYGTNDPRKVRVATSTNGISWSGSTEVLTGTGDGNRPWFNEAKSVYKMGNTYIMLYDAFGDNNYPAQIHMATSTSPTSAFANWAGNPIFVKNPVGGTWDDAAVTTPALYWNVATNRWDLYYNGTDNNASWITFRPTGYGVAQSSPLASSGSTVYLNGHTLNWPNDIRFTKSDGTSLLEYAIDSGAGGTASAQIKFPSIPTSGTSGYIYYGRSGGTSGATLTPGYVFSDDFNRANSDTIGGNWAEQGTTDGDIVSNQLQIYGDTTSQVANHVRHPLTMNQDLTVTLQVQGPSLPLNSGYSVFLLDENPTTDGAWGIQLARLPSSGLYQIQIQNSTDGSDWPFAGISWTPGVWYTFKMQYSNSARTVAFYVNDILVATQDGASISAWSSYSNNIVLSGAGAPSVNWYVDNVAVQGFPGSEATWGSWYPEESIGAPITSTGIAASITPSGATLQGTLDSLGAYSTVFAYFQYGRTPSYELGNTAEQTRTTTGGFNHILTGLASNTLYYYRAVVRYNVSFYVYGSQSTFTTLVEVITPGAPTSFGAASSASQIDLSWIKGAGSTNTLVRYSTDTYPATRTDGVRRYFSSGTSYTHTGLTAGVTYYYSAWGEADGVYSTNKATTSAMLGAPGTLPSPTAFQIDSVKIFKNYLALSDFIIVMSLKITMTTTPIMSVGDAVKIQVLDGTTLRAQGVPSDWGYRPASIYLAPGHGLTWGAIYTIKLLGRDGVWATVPSSTYTLSASSWWGDKVYMSDWILSMAERIDPTFVEYVSGSTQVLSAQGGKVFEKGIPGLKQVFPKLFLTYEGAFPVGTLPEGIKFKGAASLESALGADISKQLTSLGSYAGLSGENVGGIVWGILILFVAGTLALLVGGEVSLITSLVLVLVGSYLNLMNLVVVIIIGVLILTATLFKYLIKSGA